MREGGYYWVKFSAMGTWDIAYYRQSDKTFHFLWSTFGYYEESMIEIDERRIERSIPYSIKQSHAAERS